MPTVEELLNHKELVDYTKNRQPQKKVLEELFPPRKTEALEIKMIKGANNLPVSASIHAFDTEAEIDQREGSSYDTAELALIKRKRKLSEKEIIRLESPRNDAEEREAIGRIYNDVDDLQDSVLTRAEAMRGEALSTGKLVINENGYKTEIDYGVPANHRQTFAWSSGAPDILGNMDSVIFLGGRESSTIKEISENWLGKATISMQTEGRSRGQSESYNQNTQRLGRELMTPAELATMPGDRCILQLRGLPPFYSRKYDLKQHPNYRYTAEADKKKNAFSLERLICRRIKKLNPNEQYTVYEADVPDETPIDEDEDILNYDDLDDPDAFV